MFATSHAYLQNLMTDAALVSRRLIRRCCMTLSQDAVSAGGPLLAVLGFIILPIIWSVPEALVTAELATAFPEDSGYVAWVTARIRTLLGISGRVLVVVRASAYDRSTAADACAFSRQPHDVSSVVFSG